MDASPSRPEEGESATHSYPPIDDLDLKATVAQNSRLLAMRRAGSRGDR